jgi:hypothetical protein
LSGAAWQADLELRDLKFTSTQADPDVWIGSGGTPYDMVLVYVDDILSFAKDPKMTMDELGKLYELKPERVKEPNFFSVPIRRRSNLLNDKVKWAMGSQMYVKNTVEVVESLIAEDNPEAKLKSTSRNPFPTGNKHELDVTPGGSGTFAHVYVYSTQCYYQMSFFSGTS